MGIILKQFCCGFSLRTGSLIFFWISLFLVLLPLTSVFYDEASEIPLHSDVIFGVIYVVFSAIICLAAIIGVYMKKHEFLAPFLIFTIISIIVSLISFVLTIFWMLPIVPQDTILFFLKKVGIVGLKHFQPIFLSTASFIIFIVFWIISIGFLIYFTLISYSFYYQLMQNARSKKTDSESGLSTPSHAGTSTTTIAPKKMVSHISPKKSMSAYSRAFYNHPQNHSKQDDCFNSDIVILE